LANTLHLDKCGSSGITPDEPTRGSDEPKVYLDHAKVHRFLRDYARRLGQVEATVNYLTTLVSTLYYLALVLKDYAW
jgi:hypothetical protein